VSKVRSVLLREQSDILLYQDTKFGGDPIVLDNENTYQYGVDGCVCVNFMKRDASDYDIGSLIYTEVAADEN